MIDNGRGKDYTTTRGLADMLRDHVEHNTRWTIRKFANEEEYRIGRPYEVSTFTGNVLLNEGINELWTLVCSSGGTKFDNSNAYLGVGDGTTAESAGQTGLQGANKYYKAVDSGYPTYGTDQKATWKATFGGTEANFSWQEFTVANGNSDSAVNLNRKVSDQGTKASGQVWELTLEISLS